MEKAQWTILAAFLQAGFAISGCIVTHDASISELNEKAARHRVTVTLTDQRRFRADSLIVEPAYSSWLDPETGDVLEVPTYAIRDIHIVDHGRGALKGVDAGMTVTMDAISETTGEDPLVQVLAIGFAVALIPVFAVVGAVFGVREVYHFTATPEEAAPQNGETVADVDCDTKPPFACRRDPP